MEVEVHSIEELGGQLVEGEAVMMFRLPDDVPFTAASLEASKEADTVFESLTIMYSEEYGGLVIDFSERPTEANLLLAQSTRLPLKANTQPVSADLNILAIVSERGQGPILYVEPTQVVNGKMLAVYISRLRKIPDLNVDSWWVNSWRGALEISILDADDELEDFDSVDYPALVEQFKPRYAHYGMLIADCVYDESDKLVGVLHTVRILSDEPPAALDLDMLQHLPGVTDVHYDGDPMWPELCVSTAGSEVFAYEDPRRFIESVHALGVLIARTAGVHPLFRPDLEYRVYLGDRNTAPKLEHHFDIPSDQPKE